MADQKKNRSDNYPFVESHIAKEPYIFDLLDEIAACQRRGSQSSSNTLATFDILKSSRNIKMPFNTSREKNILYLLDTLKKNYPEEVRTIVSFEFDISQDIKKLKINETVEYTVLMTNEVLHRIQGDRDRKSTESLLQLLKKFRLFNLTKLVKKARHRTHLSILIKSQLGTTIFTFKNYTIDRASMEIAEDYCFHRDNYESVRRSLDMEGVKKIISSYSNQIMRRLKKFGILNTEFSDYRESKLDYLMNILIDELGTTLADKELAEVKNFNSLRGCLLKVDTVIDPMVSLSNDIAIYIKENEICRESELIAIFDNLTKEMMKKWSAENLNKYKILTYTDDTDEIYYLDNRYFMPKVSELHLLILYQQDVFSELGKHEKEGKEKQLDMLCSIGRDILTQYENPKNILGDELSVTKLQKIIDEYDDYKKRKSSTGTAFQEKEEKPPRRGLFVIIADFFRSLFTTSEDKERAVSRSGDVSSRPRKRVVFSKKTRDTYQAIISRKEKIGALSNFIELTPENSTEIEGLIEELRNNDKKIVIPIYHARKVLYPNRSQKYLLPDVEYLIVNPDVIQSPESIRDYTDSLAGEKIKDETIPSQGLMAIEKYLITLHRQKKSQKLRREKEKKSVK